jgi:hypothetical protein
MKIRILIFAFLFLATTAYANEATAPAETAPPEADANPYPRTPYRSDADSRLWVDLNVGLNGDFEGLGGLHTEGGLGAFLNTNLRYRAGRCGPMLTVRNESIYFWDPVHVNNYLFGAGAFCRIVGMNKWKATRGAHVDAHALAEYGKSDYAFDDGQYYRTHSGTAYSGGADLGADAFFPLWFGFWINAGLDFELNNFKYSTVSAIDGTPVTSSAMTQIALLHFGLSYSFL